MITYTFGTLFSAGEGAGCGMRAAGLEHRWGIELDDEIATVARANGFNVITQDILRADERTFESVDCLHASPPCPNFSQAKTGARETPLDIALAQKVADFIEVLEPRIFTMENVWQYRGSQSWGVIQSALRAYAWSAWHISMADYGVPSTRKRMIVAAVRGAGRVPARPRQTHAEQTGFGGGGLFSDEPTLERWVGWYKAVEDLLPGCPDSELANWQRKRLPAEYEALLFLTGNTSEVQVAPGVGCQQKDQPAGTVHTCSNGQLPRAVLVGAGGFRGEVVTASIDDPAPSVTANRNQQDQIRAVLIDGFTKNHRSDTLRIRTAEEPAPPVITHMRNTPRAIVGVRVVMLTTRCLARFQSFDDDYALPESKALACNVIGKAVPPLFMQKLYTGLLEKLRER